MATEKEINEAAEELMELLYDEVDRLAYSREEEDAFDAYTQTVEEVADWVKDEFKVDISPDTYRPTRDETKEQVKKEAADWKPDQLFNYLSPNTIYRRMYLLWLKKMVAANYEKVDRFLLKERLREGQ